MTSNESISQPTSLPKELALNVWNSERENHFSQLTRFSYFSLVLLSQGAIELKADVSSYTVEAPAVLFFSPYQPFKFGTAQPEELQLSVVNFHPDFFCILKHQQEVSCNGVLFNNLYEAPFVSLSREQLQLLSVQIQQMAEELQQEALAQHDLLLSYLKIFLIHITRYKKQADAQKAADQQALPLPERSILQKLKMSIEEHFLQEHAPSFYADKLNISVKALGKLTKQHVNRTLSDLIQERLMMEAKRELYLTDKPVKEIAYSLGFEDEYYFSRLFKKNTDTSPIQYRKTVGEDQARKLKIEY